MNIVRQSNGVSTIGKIVETVVVNSNGVLHNLLDQLKYASVYSRVP